MSALPGPPRPPRERPQPRKPELVRLPKAFGPNVWINPWRVDHIAIKAANEKAVVRVWIRDHTIETPGLSTEDAVVVCEALLRCIRGESDTR